MINKHDSRKYIQSIVLIGVLVWSAPLRAEEEKSAKPLSNDDCLGCHSDSTLETNDGRKIGMSEKPLAGSVHADHSCVDCHEQPSDYSDAPHYKKYKPVNCGNCHDEPMQAYQKSVHNLARLQNRMTAATCADCHGKHAILKVGDPKSPVHHFQIPKTCAKCHTKAERRTKDYVRLPLSLPRYSSSIHGSGWEKGKKTAVCTDCHGSHLLLSAIEPKSSTHKKNLAKTCGKCHEKVAKEYESSVHGRAIAHGIFDSPSCTDCHEEHLILDHNDPRSPVHREKLAHQVCAKCHEDPEMAVKYRLLENVVSGFTDSYHGWAVKRGGKSVAVCIDCHRTHAIRSHLDPDSSTHENHVVATCGKCHKNSNPKFAASYSHNASSDRRAPHHWARLIYIWLLAVVLGGMVLHNLIILFYQWRKHYRAHRKNQAVVRMNRSDIVQHLIVLLTFVALAISGFALRFPDSWWARSLAFMGVSEPVRRMFHRFAAVALVVGAFYHLFYMVLTRRGRRLTGQLFPRWHDISGAVSNIGYYLGLRKEKPIFHLFDYTQKAEYWALVWGTALMSLTGAILWFPDLATRWLPIWSVRVAEVVHFYEAILAVSAIVVWHLFFVVFSTRTYPMSWTWIDGRMPLEEWEEHHGKASRDDLVK